MMPSVSNAVLLALGCPKSVALSYEIQLRKKML